MIRTAKKIIIFVLIGISLFTNSVFAYDDVSQSSPYFYAIEYLRKNDVFPNTKLFKPEIYVSRAEFIKYLVLLNSPKFKVKKNVTLPFEDTQNTAWYAPYFDEAIKLGILNKNEKNAYPNKKINVAEATQLIFNSKSIPIPRKFVGTIPYKDVNNNKNLQALMMRAVELGVVKPEKPDFLGMYSKVSRAKAAYMIYKMDLVDLRDPDFLALQQVYDPALKKIIDSWNIINSDYVDKDNINSTQMSGNAIKAMVDTLKDPYSVYMDQEANTAFNDELDGQFEGIGAYVAIDEKGRITIVAPIQDSPAYKAGVKSGDVIKKVDDFSTEGATLYDVVNKIKGPKGSKVTLTLERDGGVIVIEVVRDVINVAALEYKVIGNDNIMYMKIISFGETLIKDFQEVVEIIMNNSKIKGIIVDLRDDPGGFLDAAIGVLNELLPKDSVAVQIQYSYFNVSQYTSADGSLKDYPMVVLVNKGSASASEIVAGALQDYGIAKIIGETTFGKGTVQEVDYFSDNSSLKLTVAKWLTPKARSINENGIKPDIEVKNISNDKTDYQLERALLEIGKMMK